MTIHQINKEELEKDIAPTVDKALALVIKTPEESLAAQELLREIKVRQKRVLEKMHPVVDSAHKAWKAAKDLENSFMTPLNKAEELLKKNITAFKALLDKKRDEDARKAEAERQEKERKEKEKLEVKAQKAEEKGQPEKADAYREQAETVTVAPVFTPPPVTAAVKGASFSETWKGELTDIKALCQAIAEGKASPTMVLVNQSAINAHAKANKDKWPIAGIRFFSVKNLSMRASA